MKLTFTRQSVAFCPFSILTAPYVCKFSLLTPDLQSPMNPAVSDAAVSMPHLPIRRCKKPRYAMQ